MSRAITAAEKKVIRRAIRLCRGMWRAPDYTRREVLSADSVSALLASRKRNKRKKVRR